MFSYRKKDHTICFHCGVSLQDWKLIDSFCEELAQWSPNCIYIEYVKRPNVCIKQYSSDREMPGKSVCMF